MKENPDNSLKIQNIVAAGSVADAIDLDHLIHSLAECRFDKKRFPGAVCYLQDPRAVALIFASGKIVLTGLLRQEDIDPALQNLISLLRSAGVLCTDVPQVQVRNIVCTCNLGNECNLVRIVAALMDHEWVEYEPESFPGMVCRITDPKVVFLLFSSGKTVITGGTNMADITKGLGIFREKLSMAGVL
jgi:transcription initiation factor TFIID TATA-box-binding protein